jgi:hypothetical protein
MILQAIFLCKLNQINEPLFFCSFLLFSLSMPFDLFLLKLESCGQSSSNVASLHPCIDKFSNDSFANWMKIIRYKFFFFFFFYNYNIKQPYNKIQGTLKEKEKFIPKQGGMSELNDDTEVGMQLEVNLVAAQSAT